MLQADRSLTSSRKNASCTLTPEYPTGSLAQSSLSPGAVVATGLADPGNLPEVGTVSSSVSIGNEMTGRLNGSTVYCSLSLSSVVEEFDPLKCENCSYGLDSVGSASPDDDMNASYSCCRGYAEKETSQIGTKLVAIYEYRLGEQTHIKPLLLIHFITQER